MERKTKTPAGSDQALLTGCPYGVDVCFFGRGLIRTQEWTARGLGFNVQDEGYGFRA